MAPWQDRSGREREVGRIRAQWDAVKAHALDSNATVGMLDSGTLEIDAGRYAQSLRRDGQIMTSNQGCVAWARTFRAGDLDVQALATALARGAIGPGVWATEWSLVDTAGEDTARLAMVVVHPGADGGRLDSLVLRLEGDRIRIP